MRTEKIKTLEELAPLVVATRAAGKRVVLANGAFDLLHVGHLRYLAEARGAGDLLVVAVNSDTSVRTSKGKERPIVPESERLELLSHLDVVDYLVLFDTVTVAPVLAALHPQFHAKGTDYTAESVPEAELVAAYGGKTIICGDAKRHSTTALVERLSRPGEEP